MGTEGRFQIWYRQAQRLEMGPNFATLKEAIQYVLENASKAAYGICRPDGEWYRWAESDSIMLGPIDGPNAPSVGFPE